MELITVNCMGQNVLTHWRWSMYKQSDWHLWPRIIWVCQLFPR